MLEKMIFGVIAIVIIVMVCFVGVGTTFFMLKDLGDEDAKNRRRTR